MTTTRRGGAAFRKTRHAIAIVIAASVLASAFVTFVHLSKARAESVEQDLQSSPDPRVRMRAALVLGKKHGEAPRVALEKALDDADPVVRVAAAAALGAMGDPASVPSLDARFAIETEAPPKSEIDRVRSALRASKASLAKVKWVVRMGATKDARPANERAAAGSPATGKWSDVLNGAIKTRSAAMPGAMVVDDVDSALAERVGSASGERGPGHKLPLVQLDGVLVHLAQVVIAGSSGQVGYRAQVEIVVRRLPEQTLKGSLTGAATSIDDQSATGDPAQVARLESDAVSAAVDSAMKNAERALVAAAK